MISFWFSIVSYSVYQFYYSSIFFHFMDPFNVYVNKKVNIRICFSSNFFQDIGIALLPPAK